MRVAIQTIVEICYGPILYLQDFLQTSHLLDCLHLKLKSWQSSLKFDKVHFCVILSTLRKEICRLALIRLQIDQI